MRLRKDPAEARWPRSDRGKGDLDDYRFDLRPASGNVVIRLAGSDPHQELIARASAATRIETALFRRTMEEERTDAPMPVRLFCAGRVLGPVGEVPRGLEAAVSEAVARLELAGRSTRIPVEIRRTRQGLRVELQMGSTR